MSAIRRTTNGPTTPQPPATPRIRPRSRCAPVSIECAGTRRAMCLSCGSAPTCDRYGRSRRSCRRAESTTAGRSCSSAIRRRRMSFPFWAARSTTSMTSTRRCPRRAMTSPHSMIPKKLAPDLIRGGSRFLEKIMLQRRPRHDGPEGRMRRDIFVSVVVPLENDLDILPTVVRELDAVMRAHFGDYELIFIDDGSSDGTRSFFERAKSEIPCFRYSRLTRPFGLEVAIACGLEQAIGDVIVVLNPAVDPPARIPEFAEKANDTDGIVIGIAVDKFRRSLVYRFAYQAYYGLCRMFLTRSQVYGAT